MKSFETYLSELNDAQRQAVQAIDGPVLVVAGPGTGKTQLLSLRAANIVRQTDAQPANILCLTFTESAANTMRERLVQIMGAEGNRVAVHTFHSFGTEIINQNPEYFYNGARFNPADELTGYEILREIFDTLPHSNPLAKTMNGEFTYLRDAQAAISHLKRAGLLPDELLAILGHNEAFCAALETDITQAFDGRFSKKDFPRFADLSRTLQAYEPAPMPHAVMKSLAQLCAAEFAQALSDAESSGKTNPLTTWRNRWCEKNSQGNMVFKDRARIRKLRALAHVYDLYRTKLQQESLFDFDDMVSMVAHTVESNLQLRYALQEQYQYIMVDEFQDTNGAQARLLAALADNPVNEGRPNILAVGDDDQAIYAFQGAELSNILDFANRYRDVQVITLTDNYRSTKAILQQARQVITQGEQRLENSLRTIRKELHAHTDGDTGAVLHQFASPEAEYQWTAEQIAAHIKKGVSPSEIAVIARNHKELVALVPYMHELGTAVTYDRQNNVLDSPHIIELLTLADVINELSHQHFDVAESLLPELLSYDFWGLKPDDVWRLSLRAYKERRMWLELMIEQEGRLRQIAEFIIVASHQTLHEPLETMLDILIGTRESQASDDEFSEPPADASANHDENFVSPYRDYYFSEHHLRDNPTQYMSMLSGLRALRRAIQNYRPEDTLTLSDMLDFVDLCERTGTSVVDTSTLAESTKGVSLLTAHKAKGLEFEHVYILSCQDEIWGRRARHRSTSLSFPLNMPIEPAGASFDDSLRLFFVAMTRAKRHLYLTTYTTTDNGKPSLMAEFLHGSSLEPIAHDNIAPNIEQMTPGWQHRHLTLPRATQATLLKPVLDTYKLSATHLNNFVDVSRGGPQAFLLQNLLRFPQAMTPSQAFGQAVHAVLQRAHTHLAATGEQRPIEDVMHDFELQLQQSRLGERDFTYQLEKGSEVLHAYLSARYDSFNASQKAERDFANQGVEVGGVRLTGKLDIIEVNQQDKTITVIDYKTGKGHSSWRGETDFDKIKLHKYRQQLMLYKLLVEHSRDYAGYTVGKGVLEFVEADPDGQLHRLELSPNPDEMAEFMRLLEAVWHRILTLDFPDISAYEPNYKGILQFEQDMM